MKDNQCEDEVKKGGLSVMSGGEVKADGKLSGGTEESKRDDDQTQCKDEIRHDKTIIHLTIMYIYK